MHGYDNIFEQDRRKLTVISNQVIQTSIDELKTITKIDLCVIDMEGITVATTFDNRNVSQELVKILSARRLTARL